MAITLALANGSAQSARVTVLDNYTGKTVELKIKPAQTESKDWVLSRFSGWYDLVVTVADNPSIHYHSAGHVENGKDSISDPALGGALNLSAGHETKNVESVESIASRN